MKKTIEWNKFDEARPYLTVGVLLIDQNGKFPVMFRGPKVRSAANAWGIITGLHEVGVKFIDQLDNECHEELNLRIRRNRPITQLGWYENISIEDEWHWVVNVCIARCDDMSVLQNMEPDKHTKVELVSLEDALALRDWTPGLHEFLTERYDRINREILNLTIE